MLARRLFPLLLLLTLPACEQVSNALDLPDPKKTAAAAEAEGKAIGSACRHAGRSLEDCYALNPKAQKSAVFSGWREMNDYMMQHNLQTVPSLVANPALAPQAPSPAAAMTAPGSPDAATVPPAAEDRTARRTRSAQ